MPGNYRITSVVRRTALDPTGRPVDAYHIEFVLLDHMATSFIDLPVATFTKEGRDKAIAEEVKRLEDMSKG